MLTQHDIFAKCEQFVTGPRTVRTEEVSLAAEVFGGVSPPANAGPWFSYGGRSFLQLGTNNYLGLATHPAVRARVVEVAEKYGISCPMGSRLMTGNTRLHLELEQQIAEFKRREAAAVFPAGSMATMGAVACLARPGDLLLLDEFAHASLVCGAKISGAELRYFRHNDMDRLETLLKQAGDGRSVAIVVDGVYSMQGDLGNLRELVNLKARYGARLIVDDAHGTGVFGPNGQGTAAAQGIAPSLDLEIGTFSKAVGTVGGFVAGDRAVVEYIRYNAPTMVFTKAMPLVVVAATQVALRLLEEAEPQRKQLWENTRRLQAGLRQRGFDIGNTCSPITPVRTEGNSAVYMANQLRKTFGIWVAPVLYPAVPLGTSLLRVIPTAAHSDTDIDLFLDSLSAVRQSMVMGSMPVV